MPFRLGPVALFGLCLLAPLGIASQGDVSGIVAELTAVESQAISGDAELPILSEALDLLDVHYLLNERLVEESLFRGSVEYLASKADDGLFIPGEASAPDTLIIGNRSLLLSPETITTRDELTLALAQVASFYRQATVFEDAYTAQELEYVLLKGLLKTLDRPTRLLIDKGLESFQVRSTGSLIGVGMVLRLKDGHPTVREVVDGGPSARGGVMTGDVILRINGESTLDMPMNDVVSRLRGKKGTLVAVDLRRVGREDPLKLELKRARVIVKNVRVARFDGGVGYLEITNFSNRTLTNFREALRTLQGEGELTGLVLDLRANRGGSLRQSAYISDQFLKEGLLARTVGRNDEKVQGLVGRLEARPEISVPDDIPVVVLVSRRTASGAEILAGALKEHNRALILGQRTYGKGTVQKVYDLDSDARLKATVARYLIEGDRWLQGVGLEPDIEVGAVVLEEDKVRFALGGRELEGLVPGKKDTDFAGDAEARAAQRVYYVNDRGATEDKLDREPTRVERLKKDQSVLLAAKIIRDVGGNDRLTQLAGVSQTLETFQQEQDVELEGLLMERGVNWTAHSEPETETTVLDVRVEVSLNSGSDPAFVLTPSAEDIPLSLTVTASGSQALHRVRVHLLCDDNWIGGEDFALGLLEPGESLTVNKPLRLPQRVPPGIREVTFVVFADELEEPLQIRHLVEVSEVKHPELSALFSFSDGGVDGSIGDGDGLPEPGETILLTARIMNGGEVPTGDVSLSLRNPLRKDIEILLSKETLAPIAPGAFADVSLSFEMKEVLGEVELPPVAVKIIATDRQHGRSIVEGLIFEEPREDGAPRVAAKWGKEGLKISPPKVSLSGPVPRLLADGDPLSFQGSAVDDGQIRVLTLYVDGKKVGRTLSTESTTGPETLSLIQELDLEPGSHIIELRAEDSETHLSNYRFWATAQSPSAQASVEGSSHFGN